MIHTYQNGPHTLRYTDREMRVPRKAVDHMLSMLALWQSEFPREATFVCERYGVPSLTARFDGVLSPDGTQFQTYEIQDGPGGMGYTALISADFKRIRDRLAKEHWLPFVSMRSKGMEHHDDGLWLSRMTWREVIYSHSLVAVRSPLKTVRPRARKFIIAHSVIPVDTHNDKRYGLALGLWKEISWDETNGGETLPWHERFTLKPARLFGARDMHIWGVKGSSSRRQITQALAKHGTMLLQPFIPPLVMDIEGQKYHVILRPYFGYHPQQKAWVPMHGLWTGRPYPNQRIHGASDAIHGPLIMESE